MRLFRRAARSAEARGAADLEPGERVLTVSRDRGGDPVIATDRSLLVPTPEGGRLRLAWEQVAKATWQDGELLVAEVGDVTGPGRLHRLGLADPGLLPETVRERVTASIVVSRHVPLAGKAGVLVAGRRRPGSAELTWTITFDPGVDHTDPELLARAEAALAGLRAQVES